MNFFSAKPSIIRTWLNAKGNTGTLSDAFLRYVQSGSALTRGTAEDFLIQRLHAAGYSGGLHDMLTTMFQSKTGISNRDDAERAFFANASLDMFS